MRIAIDEVHWEQQVGPGHEPAHVEFPRRPVDESEFVDLLNSTLTASTPVTPATRLREELESLELVLVWALMADLGVDLPMDDDDSRLTVRGLYALTQHNVQGGDRG
jgi:hypothetical protein